MVASSQCLWYKRSHSVQEPGQINEVEMLIFHLHPGFGTWGTPNASRAILSASDLPCWIPNSKWAISASLKDPPESFNATSATEELVDRCS